MDDFSKEHGNDVNYAWGILASLLIGILVGAGTMLLLAPQSGKRTRAKIQQKSIELRDQTTDAVEDVVVQAGVKARKIRAGVRKQAKELEKSGQTIFDEQKKRWTNFVESGKTAIESPKA